MKRTMYASLLVALLAMPLGASAAERTYNILFFDPLGGQWGSGTFTADENGGPVTSFDATVRGLRYQYLPPAGYMDAYSPSFPVTGPVFVPVGEIGLPELVSSTPRLTGSVVLGSLDDGALQPCISFIRESDGGGYAAAGCRLFVAERLLDLNWGGAYGTYAITLAQTQANLSGFFPPVDSPAVATNLAKAGQTIPLKFYAETAARVPITDLTTVDLAITSIDCIQLDEALDAVESYAAATSVPLQNLGGGYYQFNWKTAKTDALTCKLVTLELPDDYAADALLATFKFRK